MRQQKSTEYTGYRSAGIRMSEPLAEELVRMREGAEAGVLAATHAYDKAHSVMLIEQRVIPENAGAEILRGLRQMEAEGGGAVGARLRAGGGQHSGEYYLIRNFGEEVGGWDHTGRSSACLSVVGVRLMARDALLDFFDAMVALRAALLAVAQRHAESVMPGFFLTAVVQPTTFGHYLLKYAQALARHAGRLRETYCRVNQNPGGGVVLTGTAFPISRARVTDLLGFDGTVENTADAVDANDTTIECFANLAMVADSLERLSNDLGRLIASENRLVSVPDRYIAGSSLAMQMKTPMLLARGLTSALCGDLIKSFSPLGSLGSITPHQAFAAAARVVRYYAALVASLRFDSERSLALARDAYREGGGTDLAVLLVTQRGLPWRTAHQICGVLFRLAEERGIAASQIDAGLLDDASTEYFGRPLKLSDEAIQNAMDPERIVASRTHQGGSAPLRMAEQLDHQRGALATDRAWLAERREKITAASARLEAAIDAIIGG